MYGLYDYGVVTYTHTHTRMHARTHTTCDQGTPEHQFSSNQANADILIRHVESTIWILKYWVKIGYQRLRKPPSTNFHPKKQHFTYPPAILDLPFSIKKFYVKICNQQLW